jgi:ATP-dependent Lon protease
MTGELTLTGKVLPVGGIKEKVIASKRIGISELILPEANRDDFDTLPDYIKEGFTVHFAERYDQVAKVVRSAFKK